MGRTVGAAGKRKHVVATKLSDHELVALTAMRGYMLPAEYMRSLLIAERERQGLAADGSKAETA